MATHLDLENIFDSEFDIEENINIDKKLLNQEIVHENTENAVNSDIDFSIIEEDDDVNSEFTKAIVHENTEIVVDSDIDFSIIEEDDDVNSEFTKAGIPTLSFVDEETIPEVHVAECVGKKYLFCPQCNKKYERERYYNLHIADCKNKKAKGTKKLDPKSTSKKDNEGRISTETIDCKCISDNAIKDIINDPINNLKVGNNETLGNKVVAFAKIVLESDDVQSISMKTVNKVMSIVGQYDLRKNESKEKMWREIHKLYLDEKLLEEWKTLISINKLLIEQTTLQSFFHSFVMGNVTEIISTHNMLSTEKKDEEQQPLNKEEQEITYYVAGFVIFSLLKHYTNLSVKTVHKKEPILAAINLLKSLKCQGDESIKASKFEEYAQGWVEIVSRGGLVKVNNDMFIFIRRVESCVKQVLNVKLLKTYRREDLRVIINKKIVNNSFVILGWDTVSRNLSNKELSKMILKQIIDKWIDIRARAFVDSYVQILKRTVAKNKAMKTTLSKKSEPAMRKTLT